MNDYTITNSQFTNIACDINDDTNNITADFTPPFAVDTCIALTTDDHDPRLLLHALADTIAEGDSIDKTATVAEELRDRAQMVINSGVFTHYVPGVIVD